MSLMRRITRAEQRRPRRRRAGGKKPEPWPELWAIYGRPGDVSSPEVPIGEREMEAVVDAVFAAMLWEMGEGEEPAGVDWPPYMAHWLETGRVTHPLLRMALAGASGGRYVPDTEPDSGICPRDEDGGSGVLGPPA